MVINDVYQLVAAVFNKEQSGHLDPEDFNTMIYSASMELFDDRYRLYEQTQHVADILQPFKVTVALTPSGGFITLPADYGHKILLSDVTTGRSIDVIKNEHWGYRKSETTLLPADENHKIARVVGSSQYEIYPVSTKQVQLDYFKKPTVPNWAFTVSSGVFVFDEGNSTDVDWDERVINELASRVLVKFGVSLKDTDIIQYGVQNQGKELI